MPRIAMKDYDTSFFHIMIQGIRQEYIFKQEDDMKTYSRLVYKYIKKFRVKIIAYCIMNNHAHLLVYVEKIKELSEFMRAINTTYALYYNKKYKMKGYVFRNRYKAEPIYSETYLVNCINYIHNNPIKAKICNSAIEYRHSSYIEYKSDADTIINISKKIFPEVNTLFINNIDTKYDNNYKFLDYVEEKEFINADLVIEEFIKANDIRYEEIVKNKLYFKELCSKLNQDSGLTHCEIAKIFGVSRVKITRIINDI